MPKRFSNFEIVTIAVALLCGEKKYIDPEDIALKANDLAPGSFNWRNYTDRIDLGAVRVALRDAKKKKNGSLLIGDNSKGWMLSPRGIQFYSSVNLDRLISNQSALNRKDSIGEILENERYRLRQTRAYKLFVEDKLNEINLVDFYRFARINEYFKDKAKKRRLTLVENAVGNDDTLSELWRYLTSKFLRSDDHYD